MKRVAWVAVGLFVSFLAPHCVAVEVERSETQRASSWAAAKFQGTRPAGESGSYLVPEGHHTGFELNGHLGRPLRINRQDFDSGIFMGAAEGIDIHVGSEARWLADF